MDIVHIVMFQFKDIASAEQVQDASDCMLALQSACVHPTTNQPYVKSIIGGKDNSPEGLQNGITHVFIAEFETDDDRKYYLDKDPAHIAFKQRLGPLLERAQVVDFVPGSF
ncbi:hypothetical protein MMC31_005227 [Peltigera leucophlebia]|nr:hypothetical protein [Peltigera leucophlebia]